LAAISTCGLAPYKDASFRVKKTRKAIAGIFFFLFSRFSFGADIEINPCQDNPEQGCLQSHYVGNSDQFTRAA